MLRVKPVDLLMEEREEEGRREGGGSSMSCPTMMHFAAAPQNSYRLLKLIGYAFVVKALEKETFQSTGSFDLFLN